MLPVNTTTIEELIRSGKDNSLTYQTFSFIDTMSNGTKVSVYDTISDYMSELKDYSVLVKLDTDQYRKYCYKPKLLCYDIYGNPELYFIILLMNDMADVKEFNKTTVYMLPKSYMTALTSQIYNSEKAAIESYNSQYSD